MRKDLAAIVCCPVHKTSLTLAVKSTDDADDILEGTLTCGRCKFDYPIESGIPNLLPPEYHVDEVHAAKPKPAAASKKTTKVKGKS